MKLAIATANWPHPAHTIRGANVLAFELIRALESNGGADYLSPDPPAGTAALPADMNRMRGSGPVHSGQPRTH
jgi:hypothetical protein